MSWESIDPGGVLHTATYNFPGGVSRSTIAQVSDDTVVVYSPGSGREDAAAPLVDGKRIFLLAPSAGHLLGVDAWTQRFPEAVVVAGDVTAARIPKKTSVRDVRPIAHLDDHLGPQASTHVVPACRSSEVWLRVDVDGRMHWMVCDAMMNVQTLPSSTLLRWAVLLYGIRTGLHVSPMFRHVIIRDKRTFRTWALDKLRAAPDNVLVPCHGHVADEPNLTGRLVELIERRF